MKVSNTYRYVDVSLVGADPITLRCTSEKEQVDLSRGGEECLAAIREKYGEREVERASTRTRVQYDVALGPLDPPPPTLDQEMTRKIYVLWSGGARAYPTIEEARAEATREEGKIVIRIWTEKVGR